MNGVVGGQGDSGGSTGGNGHCGGNNSTGVGFLYNLFCEIGIGAS